MRALESGIYAILDIDRLAGVLPDDAVGERELLLAYAAVAVEAGAVALQLRDKGAPAHSLHLASIYSALVDAFGDRCLIVMNDHLVAVQPVANRLAVRDAKSGGADDEAGSEAESAATHAKALRDAQATALTARIGLHLGQGDASPLTARHALGNDAVIGVSTHNLEQIAHGCELPVDYLGYGPIAATHSKTGAGDALGIAALREAVALATKPVVAIGGLTIDDVPAVRATGAHAMAVIGAWLGPAGRPHNVKRASLAITMLAATWAACEGAGA
jgi:thiamine monophosphate synthase